LMDLCIPTMLPLLETTTFKIQVSVQQDPSQNYVDFVV
jgi:hypothetical protein